MGYRYQSKIDEENERRYWEHRPRWLHTLVRWLEIALFTLLGLLILYGSFGWIIIRFLPT